MISRLRHEFEVRDAPRHAVPSGSDSGFPWYAGARLAGEPGDVMRMPAGEGATRAAMPLVLEQIPAAFEAVASWLSGTADNARRIPAN